MEDAVFPFVKENSELDGTLDPLLVPLAWPFTRAWGPRLFSGGIPLVAKSCLLVSEAGGAWVVFGAAG